MFSPYYAWARRRGRGDPVHHCALNVALYGETKRWAMTERPRGSIERLANSFSVGPSSVSWDGDALTIRIDEITVPFPSRLRGTVRVHPAAVTQQNFVLNEDGNHRWWPIAPRARVQATFDDPSLRWLGDGYFDTNTGDAPLEDGFTTWQWSRAAMRDGTAILYEADKRGGGVAELALKYDASGSFEQFEPPPRVALARSGWRMARSTRSDTPDGTKVDRTLEDAPFYARSIVSGHLLGEPVTMMHESLSLDRFRNPLVQAMLPFRMPRARR